MAAESVPGTQVMQITAGTVVYQDDNRLQKWVKHWEKLVDNIIVLDQCRYKWPLKDKPLNLLHEPVTPSGNPDLHWNTLIALATGSYLLRHGVDEFISESHMKYIREQIVAHPAVRVWYLRRKNMVDGKDTAYMFAYGDEYSPSDPEGYDWQPVLLKVVPGTPPPIRFGVKMHTHPQVLVGPHEVAFMNPEQCWITHERTKEECAEANQKRFNFLDSTGKRQQDIFMAGLERLNNGEA